jgi:hypothetical protein
VEQEVELLKTKEGVGANFGQQLSQEMCRVGGLGVQNGWVGG